ncbi:ABC transporter permease [Candidatus Woesearchaeota archaeon]|nr:ABC transporter permease [Candidatus Woesearchaeota archaeon]
MNTLWLLTKKNLQLLLRAKSSALIVVFAPLLTILILGLSFNNSAKYGINIGVYAPVFSPDVEAFVSTLQEGEFKIVKYEANIEECIEDLKQGFVHSCISLPESLSVESNRPKEITFYVDPSRVNLVWMVEETVKNKFNLKSQQLSEELAQDMLSRLQQTKTGLAEEKATVASAKDKSSTAAGSTNAIKSGLSSVDVAPPTTTYDLTALTTFKENLAGRLTEGKSKISAARGALSDSNVSSTAKTKISSFLTQAEAELIAAEESFANNTGEGSFAAVSTLVESLNTDLTSAKAKLAAAGEKVASAGTGLDGVQTSLQETLKLLESAQNNANSMLSTLEAQKVTDATVLSSPLITKVERVAAGKTYLNYLFSGLLVLVIMFSSLLLGTTLVMMEKNSPAFLRNFFVPIQKVTFILSTYLTTLVLIVVQLAIILGIALIFLPQSYVALPLSGLILFFAASVFTFIGMLIGYVFVSEETGVLASISAGSMMLFVSGLILPLESMSASLRNVIAFNPFVIAERLIREVVIFDASIKVLWQDLLILFGYAAVLFLLILIVESVLHDRLKDRILHRHQKQP